MSEDQLPEAKARPLDAAEQRVMDIVNLFNKLSDDGAQFGKLTMTEDSLRVVTRHNIAMPIKVTRDPVQQRMIAHFPLIEYQKYVAFACRQVGFTLLLNGGVRTKDGLIVAGTFPADAKGKPPKRAS